MTTTVQKKIDAPSIIDIAFGRWRSQILHAGVTLGVFDALHATQAIAISDLASTLGVEPVRLGRLLRALDSMGLVQLDQSGEARLIAGAEQLRCDHPQSLRSMVLLEEGVVHCRVWQELPSIIKDGGSGGFVRAYGHDVFEHVRQDAHYHSVFQAAMTSYSASEAHFFTEAIASVPDLQSSTWCDVGGGEGRLLASLLRERTGIRGIVLDLPEVVQSAKSPSTNIELVAGDMFKSVPAADVYVLKHILHDWDDAQCRDILASIRRACRAGARLLIGEWVVAETPGADFAKIMDIHMMCVSTGRQRTVSEFNAMLQDAGWFFKEHIQSPGAPLSIVRAIAM